MLRVGFLPSDFNPMVLMLGEAEDLHRLAATLRQFARHPTDAAAEPSVFLWRLDPAHAQAFADQIDQLAQPSRVAGSEILACSTGEEIPVKVSRGEYTDDFLQVL